jgi:hypothetical protein
MFLLILIGTSVSVHLIPFYSSFDTKATSGVNAHGTPEGIHRLGDQFVEKLFRIRPFPSDVEKASSQTSS